MQKIWQKAQKWELNWHESCTNSLFEEEKQIIYAKKMGLIFSPTPKTPYNIDLKGRSILDIGAGPYSLLLKCVNFELGVEGAQSGTAVTDPLMNKFPKWVRERYKEIGITVKDMRGEDLITLNNGGIFDEVWIYNVLEHTYKPKKLVENALELGKIVRIFEWIDTPPSEGHPHTLTEKFLNKWLGGEGVVSIIKRGNTIGKAYHGIFKGNHYE